MELKQFDYTKNPYATSKVYDIHPLSRDGFTQYISNDSFTHRYIKNKFDSKILERIYGVETSRPNTSHQNYYNSNNKLNSNYDNYQSQTNPNYNKTNINVNDPHDKYERLNSDFEKNENMCELKNIENLKSNLFPNNTSSDLYNYNNKNNFSERNHNLNNNNKLDNGDNYNLDHFRQSNRNCYSSYNRAPSLNRKTNYSNGEGSNGNKNNLHKFLNMKKNLNKKHNPKDNIRWETNYPSNIEYLKKNQNLFFDFNPNEENLNSFSRKKKYDGFESFNIPRLDNLQADASKPAFHYTQRLVKSCIGRRKENSNNINHKNNPGNEVNSANSNPKDEENNEQVTVEKIKEENQKLKNILNMQTNKDFLRTGNMPKISYVALQPKLVIKKFGLGGQGKFLGGKYNPDNFQTGRGNDRNRRNYVGGLYSN